MDWQPIESAPMYEDILLAAKYEPEHLTWKYGVGRYSKVIGGEGRVLWEWPWTYPPQWWARIEPPVAKK